MVMIPIAPHITAYLRERLPIECGASVHTCDTYAYAFQLFFEFASRKLQVPPSKLHLEQLDVALILEFLEHLQNERGNGARTRNARLGSIKSFMRFMEHRVPSALDQIKRVLAIPTQKTDTKLVRHLTDDECQAILDAPDPTTRLGTRDRAMIYMALTAGLRVSELVGLPLQNVTFEGRYADIHVMGKGRKQRALRLWKSVADSLRAWLAIRGNAKTVEFFVNARGESMTRSGFKHVLQKHVAVAQEACSSLKTKTVSPHCLRHTCGLTILRATGDIRKVALWLGHAHVQTTEVYLAIDPTDRMDVLSVLEPPALRPGKFRPPDKLISSLRGP
jgi:site-specific recombinase XerD